MTTPATAAANRPIWLIVEDEPADREVLEWAVAKAGDTVELVIVEDGRSALRALDDGTVLPALIMLDLNLPDIPGTEVLAEIRESPRTASIPVLVLSGSVDQHLIDTAYRNGANAYFAKPDTPDGLTKLVESIYLHWHVAAQLPS